MGPPCCNAARVSAAGQGTQARPWRNCVGQAGLRTASRRRRGAMPRRLAPMRATRALPAPSGRESAPSAAIRRLSRGAAPRPRRRAAAAETNMVQASMRRLSGPNRGRGRMARVTGLEPATSGVTGRHSNRLSYTRASTLGQARAASLGGQLSGRRDGVKHGRNGFRRPTHAFPAMGHRTTRRPDGRMLCCCGPGRKRLNVRTGRGD